MAKRNPIPSAIDPNSAAVIAAARIDEDTLGQPPEFLACKCTTAMPGRGCMRCSGTKYMKRCHDCNGSGLLFKNTRRGAEPRSERCGRCVGMGWISAMPSDRHAIAEFEAANPELVAS